MIGAKGRFAVALASTTLIHAALIVPLLQTKPARQQTRCSTVEVAIVDFPAEKTKKALPNQKPPKKEAPESRMKPQEKPETVSEPKKVSKPNAAAKPKSVPKPKAAVEPQKASRKQTPLKTVPLKPVARNNAPRPVAPAPRNMPLEPSLTKVPTTPETEPPTEKNTHHVQHNKTPSDTTRAQRAFEARENYLGRLRRQIQSHLRYPMSARRLKLEGESLLRFSILGDGSVSALRLDRSSGHAILDRRALATVESAGPFEAPPEGGTIDVVLPVNFSLDQG